MPQIKTRNDVSLYCKIWGDGRPVVLIHGWPLSSDSWDAQANGIAEAGYRVIAYDRRGFGRSEQPWTGYDYDTLADDLADVMAATGVSSDATLVGFSMGGGEVARYMSRHGGKGVNKAALISSVVPFLMQTEDNPDGVPSAIFAQMTAGMLADRPKFMAGFLADFFGQGLLNRQVTGATIDWAWAQCMQAGLRPTLECAKSFSSTDFSDELEAFTVPTLIVHGTADVTVPIDPTGREAAASISGAHLIEYEGAPHGLFVTEQDRLTKDLLTFLSQ